MGRDELNPLLAFDFDDAIDVDEEDDDDDDDDGTASIIEGEPGLDFPDGLDDDTAAADEDTDDVEDTDGPPSIKFVCVLGRRMVCRFVNFDGFVYIGRLYSKWVIEWSIFRGIHVIYFLE